jgi:hypothetical protein
MSDRVYSCEEGVALFKSGKVTLTNPVPFNTSKSAELQFHGPDGKIDGNPFRFKTPKITMPNYPIGPAEMPSKTTFPLQSTAKLNVPTNPDKTLSDLCAAAQEFGIKAVEEKKALVSFLFRFLTVPAMNSYPTIFFLPLPSFITPTRAVQDP